MNIKKTTKISILPMVLLLVLASVVFAQDPSLQQSITELKGQIYRAEEAGNDTEAIELRNRLIQQFPSFTDDVADAYIKIGHYYKDKGLFEDAIDSYDHVALDSSFSDARRAEAIWWNAFCYHNLGEYNKAKILLKDILENYKDTSSSLEAEWLYADVLMKLKSDVGMVIAVYWVNGFTTGKEYSNYYNSMLIDLYKEVYNNDSQADWVRAHALINTSQLHSDMGNLNTALNYANRCINKYPEHADLARYMKILRLDDLGLESLVDRNIAEMNEVNPGTGQFVKGVLVEREGDLLEANSYFLEAVDMLQDYKSDITSNMFIAAIGTSVTLGKTETADNVKRKFLDAKPGIYREVYQNDRVAFEKELAEK